MPIRKRLSIVAVSALLVLVPFAALQAQQSSYATAAKLVEEARPKLGAPGVSVAIAVDDRLVYSTGYGLADVENQVPAKANTIYRIASISKPMAATALMQLVEQGRVSLDDPVQQYVPAFPDKIVTITLRHILTHTSGIRHYKPAENPSQKPFDSIADAIAIFKDDPLLFTPGTKYSYSSYAYNLIAGVIEKASGLTFEAYMQEKVWGPAGMKETRLEHPPEIVPNRARQYLRGGDGPGVVNAPYADLSIKWAGGGIISTVEDLLRFHIALDEEKLVRRETLEQMYTPATLNDGSKIDYALGWRIQTDQQGRRWVFHSGGATGGSTFLLRDPERRLAVAIMCNVESAGNLGALARQVAEVALQSKPTTSRELALTAVWR